MNFLLTFEIRRFGKMTRYFCKHQIWTVFPRTDPWKMHVGNDKSFKNPFERILLLIYVQMFALNHFPNYRFIYTAVYLHSIHWLARTEERKYFHIYIWRRRLQWHFFFTNPFVYKSTVRWWNPVGIIICDISYKCDNLP